MFKEFFKQATGSEPYPYQERFSATNPLPHLLRVPTGAGKTATAILGWLWHQKPNRAELSGDWFTACQCECWSSSHIARRKIGWRI